MCRNMWGQDTHTVCVCVFVRLLHVRLCVCVCVQWCADPQSVYVNGTIVNAKSCTASTNVGPNQAYCPSSSFAFGHGNTCTSPQAICNQHSTSGCSSCTQSSTCGFCTSTGRCEYTADDVYPYANDCSSGSSSFPTFTAQCASTDPCQAYTDCNQCNAVANHYQCGVRTMQATHTAQWR